MKLSDVCVFSSKRISLKHECISDIPNRTQDPEELADAYLNIACTYMSEESWENARLNLNKAKDLAPQVSAILEIEKELTSKASPISIASRQTMFGDSKRDATFQSSTHVEEPDLGSKF